MSILSRKSVAVVTISVLAFMFMFVTPVGNDIAESEAEIVEETAVAQAPAPEAVTAQVQSASEVFSAPVSRVQVSSPFGAKRSRGRTHTGADLRNPRGTPIMASKSGTVIFAGWHPTYGNIVKIAHGNGQQTYYAHLDTIGVASGQQVKQGQTIATTGRTGNATGYICHFEVRLWGKPVNPMGMIGKAS